MNKEKFIFFAFIMIFIIFYCAKNKQESFVINFNSDYMNNAFKKNNIIHNRSNKTLRKGDYSLSYITHFNSPYGKMICRNKELTLNKLSKYNIPITDYYLWNNEISYYNNINNINRKLKYPLVLKETDGSLGRNIFVNINNSQEVINAVNKLKKNNNNNKKNNILVENQLYGNNYRILVFNNNIIDCVERIKPYVIGNGHNTLYDLINKYNIEQENSGLFKVVNISYNYIQEQGFNKYSVIPEGKTVYITNVINLNNGAKVKRINIEDIHPDNIKLFKNVNKVLQLNLSGIDYMSKTISESYKKHGYILEVNDSPGIVASAYLDKTSDRSAINDLVDKIF